MIFGREPALIAGAIAIAINLAISFGLQLTPEQVSLINALTVAVLAIVVRQQVTPIHDPVLKSGTDVKVQGTDEHVTVTDHTPPGAVG